MKYSERFIKAYHTSITKYEWMIKIIANKSKCFVSTESLTTFYWSYQTEGKNRLKVFKQKVFGFPNKYFTKNTST